MSRRVAMWVWVDGKRHGVRHDVVMVPRAGDRLVVDSGQADPPTLDLVVLAVIWDLRENIPGQTDEWAVHLECERKK